MKSIEIPDTVSEMGDYVFYSSELESVKLSSGLKKLGKNLFDSCDMLTDVTIPDGVTTIGAFCFSDCGISNITVPDSVTNISGNPFDSDMKITWKGTTYEDSYDFMKAFKGQS